MTYEDSIKFTKVSEDTYEEISSGREWKIGNRGIKLKLTDLKIIDHFSENKINVADEPIVSPSSDNDRYLSAKGIFDDLNIYTPYDDSHYKKVISKNQEMTYHIYLHYPNSYDSYEYHFVYFKYDLIEFYISESTFEAIVKQLEQFNTVELRIDIYLHNALNDNHHPIHVALPQDITKEPVGVINGISIISTQNDSFRSSFLEDSYITENEDKEITLKQFQTVVAVATIVIVLAIIIF